MCDAKTLSHKGRVMISQCVDCKTINIWCNNLIFNFTVEQFTSFKKFTEDLDFDERSLPFPDQQDRVVLKTPIDHVNFTFTLDEWDDFHEAMNEAYYMQQVLALI